MFFSPTNLGTLTAEILRDSLAFAPELILSATIVVLLLLRMFKAFDHVHLGRFALAGTALALLVAFGQWQTRGWFGLKSPEAFFEAYKTRDIFSGLLVYDNFTVFLRLFLLSFTLLVIWLTLLTRIPDAEDSADFYSLLLGSVVGMSLMASTNHLMMMFIGVEMASLPSYALAGFLKGRRQSSEAALKYVVYGGGASGVMLYGISLLAGKFGTAYLPDLAAGFVTAVGHGGVDPVLILGTIFILVGISFKLAAVPFHFWCPDVFEGAAAEVAGFLSVSSKGAALALLARVALTFGGLFPGAGEVVNAHWGQVVDYLVPVLSVLAIVTATFGNLAAYLQNNLKRLLAYSTIAHAGYMMMGLSTLNREGAAAVLFYLMIYLLMNLGAFAVVAFLRNLVPGERAEELDSYRGLVSRAPWMVVTLGIFLLSLLGMPPLAGFVAKFQIFQALFVSAQEYGVNGATGLSTMLYIVLVAGGINSVLSAVYYLKVLKVMALEPTVEQVEGKTPAPLAEPTSTVFYAGILSGLLLVVGLGWNGLAEASKKGVAAFPDKPGAAITMQAQAEGEGKVSGD
jgi:NADH-quinone oxidoreductase subunit N